MRNGPSPLDNFDPNSKPNQPFATYCPSRRNDGAFKTHGTRVSALNGLRYQGYGILYTWDGRKWTEVVRVEPVAHRPERCSRCNQRTMRPVTTWDGVRHAHVPRTDLPPHNMIQWDWARRGSKLIEPLTVEYLCSACKR